MVHTATSEDKYCCPKCKSCHVDFYDYKGKKYQSCLDCGHEEYRNALYTLAFDEVMIKQLQKAAKQQQVKNILQSMLDELEIKTSEEKQQRTIAKIKLKVKNF